MHCKKLFSGLRSLAKLCLNSFWGKFGQRCNLTQDEFVTAPDKFADIIFNETYEVSFF